MKETAFYLIFRGFIVQLKDVDFRKAALLTIGGIDKIKVK